MTNKVLSVKSSSKGELQSRPGAPLALHAFFRHWGSSYAASSLLSAAHSLEACRVPRDDGKAATMPDDVNAPRLLGPATCFLYSVRLFVCFLREASSLSLTPPSISGSSLLLFFRLMPCRGVQIVPGLSRPTSSVMLYDDEDHGLFLTPKFCTYSAERGGASRHMLVNGTAQRLVIKVKCSNNGLYRVNPVHAFLDPGCSLRLQIVRDPGPPQKDKLVLLYKPAAGLHSNARDDYEVSEEEPKRTLVLLLAADKGNSESKEEQAPPPVPSSSPPAANPRMFNVHETLNRMSVSFPPNCKA